MAVFKLQFNVAFYLSLWLIKNLASIKKQGGCKWYKGVDFSLVSQSKFWSFMHQNEEEKG